MVDPRADFHTCPIVKGLVPDVGSGVVKGSLTAARVADMIVEAMSVNSIVIGEFILLLGG